jgi:two-component system, NtrC family, sensor histidine kinase HydH
MGLRLRLFFVLIIPLTLLVGLYAVVRIREEEGQLLAAEQRNAAVTARAIQIAVENAVRDRQIADIRRLLSELVNRQEQIERIRIYDKSLTSTLESEPGAAGGPVAAERLRRVMTLGRLEVVAEEGLHADTFSYVMPLRGRRGEIIGALEVLFSSPGAREKRERATRDAIIRLSLLALGLAGLTTFVLSRQVLRPLGHLTRSIRALGEGQAGPPLPVGRRDEVGEVAEAFNRMAESLETARQQLLLESDRAVDLEQQLRRAETLAVAGKLTSGIAHEVGTPLNIISGRAEILLRSLPADHPGRPDLEVIVAQTDRISAIIRSLLDTVRQQKPEIQAVDIPVLLDRVVPLLEHMARRRGVSIAASAAPPLPEVAADPTQAQQVLINLIVNAMDATPRGGRIGIEAWACPNDGRPGVAVAVSDTGSGIPAEALSHVFEPFFTTKPAGQGTGLGLPICRDILREHGGTLAVQSREGHGTTFTAWLPVHEAAV